MATGQLLASVRMLGGEGRAIEELAKDFIMLQTAIQAMNQGYTIFTSVTDAITAYQKAAQMAASGTASMTAAAGPAAAGTTAVAGSATAAAASVSLLNVALGAALPLLASLAVRHWAWHRVQQQNAEMEEQIRQQVSLTTGTINARTDALQRYIDLEKAQRQFVDANRPETKTRKEIIEDFEKQKGSDERALQFEASRTLRNEFQKAQDKQVSGDSVLAMQRSALQNINRFDGGTAGEALALLERERDTAINRQKNAPEGSLERFNAEKDLKDIARMRGGIERETGIADLRSANKAVMDGTDAEELSQIGNNLSGAGQFGAGGQIADLAKQAALQRMNATTALEAEAKRSMQLIDKKIAEQMETGSRSLDQSVFEEKAVDVRERFDLEEGNRQQLRALQVTSKEGDEYGEGRQKTFNRLVSFAESQGLASDAIPEWKIAKRTQDTEMANAILDRLGRGETDQVADEQADKLAEGVDALRRQRQALENIKFQEFAEAAIQSAEVAEKVELSQRAYGF
jgi:hypothetical protein